jgi:anion-transporting  ArsA/GET3 family ATPase
MGQVYSQQKIVFVTGKGGVGKSSVAAAMAMNEARAGRRTLLAELSHRSYLGPLFGLAPTAQSVELEPNLHLSLLTGEYCLFEFLRHYIRLDGVVKLFFSNPVMSSLINAAPALKELAILGKITSGLRGIGPDFPYDRIVVDAYATGHFKALMMVPKGMGEVIRFGPMGDQSRAIDEVLRNPELCQYKVVTLPEELPIEESLDLLSWIHGELGQKGDVYLNKVRPLPLPMPRLLELSRSGDLEPKGFQKFVSYLASVGQRQMESSQRLFEKCEAVESLPMVYSSDASHRIGILTESVGLAWKS